MFNTLTRMGASAAGAYEIERSLRFNSGDTTKLERTIQSGGSTTTWTFSVWIKKTSFGATKPICGYYSADTNSQHPMRFNSSDQLEWYNYTGGYQGRLVTNRKFRDPSAWYHLVFVWDTTNGTAGDRMKIYVNGVEETSFATDSNPSSSQASHWNTNVLHAIGTTSNYNDGWFDGYITEVNFIDGAVKQASDFGETDSITGAWIPKKYGGSYGTTGFYLNFSDNSNTTSGTLGADGAGSNDWTPTNFSVATDDEIACDSFSDTPTNNWCTMNPINNPNGATLNNGGLEVNLVYPHDDNGVYATFGVTSGKWYWEAKCTSAGNRGQVGVTDAGHKSGSNSGYNYSVATRHTGSTSDTSGTSNSNLDAVIDSGNWVTFCFDADNGQIWYSREAAPNISGTANVTGLTLGPGRSWQPHIRETGNPVSNFTFNFGASAAGFKYGPPNDDYKPLNAANLPEPTIKKPDDHFVVKTYSGTGSTQTITTGLDADLVWVKRRDSSNYHILANTISGAGSYLVSNETDAESDGGSQLINGLSSTGFQVGTENAVNNSSGTYVSWNWKESASAGFDIVSYTGTGSNPQTRAHSLGVAPEMIILKSRSGTNGDEHWAVYHHAHSSTAATSATYFGRLNTLDDFEDLEMWNDTVPTSSVFTTQNHAISNYDGDTFIAYLFTSIEGYSKVGSYKGNGNANGAFVNLGFRPAFLLIKCTNGDESWEIYDNKRLGYNVNNESLFPDLSNAESSEDRVDLLSNGFKARINSGGLNGSNKNYIYYAIAETSFKYSNAR